MPLHFCCAHVYICIAIITGVLLCLCIFAVHIYICIAITGVLLCLCIFAVHIYICIAIYWSFVMPLHFFLLCTVTYV